MKNKKKQKRREITVAEMVGFDLDKFFEEEDFKDCIKIEKNKNGYHKQKNKKSNIKLIKQSYKIPKSYIQEDYGILEIVIKTFKVNSEGKMVMENGKEGKKAAENLLKIIEEYIEDNGINADISGLYNKIFEEIEYHVTFKARDKSTLADNNIHFQIIV